jgi:hypothetical protein
LTKLWSGFAPELLSVYKGLDGSLGHSRAQKPAIRIFLSSITSITSSTFRVCPDQPKSQ